MKEKIKIFIKSKPFLYKIYLIMFYYTGYLLHRYIITKRVKNYYLNEKVNFVKLPAKNNSFFGYYNLFYLHLEEECL